MADDAIEVLLEEGRTFPPPDEFRESGNLNDPAVWEKADKDPEAFWAEQAQQLDWFKTWDKVLEWGLSLGQVVHRRQAQRLLQLPGPARQDRPQEQGRHHLGGRARRRTRADLPRRLARGEQVRQRAQGSRGAERRPRGPSTWAWCRSC